MLMMGSLVLQCLHPMTAGPIAGLATIMLYLAVLAPVFWVPRLKIDANDFRRVVVTFWLFYSASALIGMLQIYFPGTFDIPSYYIENTATANLDPLKIRLASGQLVFRPMGLTDQPGGAAIGGFYACVLGAGLVLDNMRWWLRALALASMMIGVFVIYLSYVRSLLIMSFICLIASALVLAVRGNIGKVAIFSGLIAVVFLFAGILALDVGGVGVSDRLGTLTAASPGEVYHRNRGVFFQQTIEELLPEYPLGAGLGRWGMMSIYFGDFSEGRGPLYAEIQWTGWLLDGGFLLFLAYPAAILSSIWLAIKLALSRFNSETGLWIWGGIIAGYDVGTLVSTFNCPIFNGTSGVEFWMLNGALFTAAMSKVNLEPSALASSGDLASLPTKTLALSGPKISRTTPSDG
jgi:hypothetical protein